MPILTFRLPGRATPLPDTVRVRAMRGIPSRTASETAIAVPTFWTSAPTSIGSFPEGITRPRTALINCFSAPWG